MEPACERQSTIEITRIHTYTSRAEGEPFVTHLLFWRVYWLVSTWLLVMAYLTPLYHGHGAVAT
jgi:hypothetical protein